MKNHTDIGLRVSRTENDVIALYDEIAKHRAETRAGFSKVQAAMDQRFDAVDQRFDAVDQRFDRVEGLLETLVEQRPGRS